MIHSYLNIEHQETPARQLGQANLMFSSPIDSVGWACWLAVLPTLKAGMSTDMHRLTNCRKRAVFLSIALCSHIVPPVARDMLGRVSPFDEIQLIRELEQITPEDWLKEVIPPEWSGNIYHYTKAEGLLGILKSGCVWASHFLGMNDVSEVHYARQLAVDILKKVSTTVADETRQCLERVGGILGAFDLVVPPYLVCFCDHGNLLSQWREYGSRGDGFSIGFDVSALRNGLMGNLVPRKVIYDRPQQEYIMRTMTERCCGAMEKHKNVKGASHLMGRRLTGLLTSLLVVFKNPEFQEEREWRLVHLDGFPHSLPTNYRAGRFGIVPYKELHMANGEKLPVKHIWQGPTSDRTLAKHSVEMLVGDLGYTGVKIDVSEIPLR
jgi:hypothetical protein